MVIKISINAVEQYLGSVLGFWIAEHDVESDSLDDYKEYVLDMGKHVKKWNDEKYVQLAFAYLIESKNISQELWDRLENECNYSFVEFEFKEIVEYAYSVLWSNIPSSEVLKGFEVEFIKTGIDLTKWYSVRDELNPLFNRKN